MIYSLGTKRELVEIVNIQIDEYQLLQKRIAELESGLNLCKEFLELMHQMDQNWTIKESLTLRKIVIEILKGGE